MGQMQIDSPSPLKSDPFHGGCMVISPTLCVSFKHAGTV